MDPVQMLMQQAIGSTNTLASTSRYNEVGTDTTALDDGREVVFFQRRILPQLESLEALATHTVIPGDRLDRLANHYFGNPELYWRICDANGVMRPADLTDNPPKSGQPREIRICHPEGFIPPPEFPE